MQMHSIESSWASQVEVLSLQAVISSNTANVGGGAWARGQRTSHLLTMQKFGTPNTDLLQGSPLVRCYAAPCWQTRAPP